MQHIRAMGARSVPPRLAQSSHRSAGPDEPRRKCGTTVSASWRRAVVVAALLAVAAAREACIGSVTGVRIGDAAATVGTSILDEALAVAVGPHGDVYYSTSQYPAVLQIRGDGTVAVVVGSSSGAGAYDPSREGGPAILASVAAPWGIDTMPNGDLLLADWRNVRVWRVSAANATIRTFVTGAPSACGGSAAAAFGSMWPLGVASHEAGNVYVLDRHSRRVIRVGAAERTARSASSLATQRTAGVGTAALPPMRCSSTHAASP